MRSSGSPHSGRAIFHWWGARDEGECTLDTRVSSLEHPVHDVLGTAKGKVLRTISCVRKTEIISISKDLLYRLTNGIFIFSLNIKHIPEMS